VAAGIKEFFNRTIFSPWKRGMEETLRRQYGMGAMESANPGRGQPYYYIPSSVPGLYFRGSTVGRPAGGK